MLINFSFASRTTNHTSRCPVINCISRKSLYFENHSRVRKFKVVYANNISEREMIICNSLFLKFNTRKLLVNKMEKYLFYDWDHIREIKVAEKILYYIILYYIFSLDKGRYCFSLCVVLFYNFNITNTIENSSISRDKLTFASVSVY